MGSAVLVFLPLHSFFVDVEEESIVQVIPSEAGGVFGEKTNA